MSSRLPDRFGSGPAGVALAYVAASWILIQVVESFDSLLGLPDSLVRGALVLLLVGFPVVTMTAWVQARRGAARGSAEGVLGLFTWRNALSGGVGALALWGGVAAVWLVARGPVEPGPPAEPDADGSRVLAVLPFENLLPDAEEQAWLVAGLHEQVIHELAGLPGLRVISRTSVLPYAGTDLSVPQIAERLGAGVVLEGSVRGDAERLRVTLQLIDAATDEHRWSEEYDATLGNLLEMQSTVAVRVARRFERSLGPEARARIETPPTENPEALQAYWRGRHLWKNLGAPPGEQTTALFRRAVTLDPDFALAWAGLAEAWLNSAHVGTPPHVAFPRADSAAVQALARDPDLADAHVALADTRFHYEWNWEGAERGFRRALELKPSHGTGHWFYAGLLAALGRGDEAVAQLERARTVEPLAAMVDAFGARVLYWDRRFDEAEETARRALELSSDHFYALGVLGFIHLQKGEPEEAVDAFRRSVEVSPKFRSGLVMALAAAGRIEEAREIASDLEVDAAERYVPPYERAFAYVGLGDRERALDLLEEATETRDAELIWIGVEPALDPLRDEPRFQAILRELGLAR